MHWRMNHRSQRAMRSGPWKYLQVDANEYLFNIDVDARERSNQAHRYPDRMAAMRDAWLTWNQSMPLDPR